MRHPSPGHFRTAQDLRAHLTTLGAGFDLDDDVASDGSLAQPLQVFGRTLGNRFCTHPMEGWDGTEGGGPSEHTKRRWRHFGRSGAALVFGGEAFAVTRDGRANPHQLCLGLPPRRGVIASCHRGRQRNQRQATRALLPCSRRDAHTNPRTSPPLQKHNPSCNVRRNPPPNTIAPRPGPTSAASPTPRAGGSRPDADRITCGPTS